MDAPLKELERIQALQARGRELLEAGRPQEALAVAAAALALEGGNLRSLTLKADTLERTGQEAEATALRGRIRLLRKEAWQREVEAEIRGHHDLLGQAIRHERL